MKKQLTLICNIKDLIDSAQVTLDKKYSLDVINSKKDLTELYREIYDFKLSYAEEEIEKAYKNEYGKLIPLACLSLKYDNTLVGAILTVQNAPWEDTPDSPFIIDLMVKEEHQRKGLGTYLMEQVGHVLLEQNKKTTALKVMESNEKALNLYIKMGFKTFC
jgi:ribosomal protein S18 acetylase RimI-like enzyme